MFRSPGMTPLVMAGLVPAIHALLVARKTWMPGTRPGMTAERPCVDFDQNGGRLGILRRCGLPLPDCAALHPGYELPHAGRVPHQSATTLAMVSVTCLMLA